MTPLWAQNKATLGTEAEPDLAPDIKRLRGIVDKFESPYVEIVYYQRVAAVRKKWPLYGYDLSALSSSEQPSDPSDLQPVNSNTEDGV